MVPFSYYLLAIHCKAEKPVITQTFPPVILHTWGNVISVCHLFVCLFICAWYCLLFWKITGLCGQEVQDEVIRCFCAWSPLELNATCSNHRLQVNQSIVFKTFYNWKTHTAICCIEFEANKALNHHRTMILCWTKAPLTCVRLFFLLSMQNYGLIYLAYNSGLQLVMWIKEQF